MGPGEAVRARDWRPVPPRGAAALTSPEYATEFNAVKQLGEIDLEQRTPDQTKAALFWSNDQGSYTTAGHWNNIATDLLAGQGAGVEDSAHLLTELNVALVDLPHLVHRRFHPQSCGYRSVPRARRALQFT